MFVIVGIILEGGQRRRFRGVRGGEGVGRGGD